MTDTRDHAAFTRLSTEAWGLWFDAAQVIWLRSMRLAAGGALGTREAQRMVEEKAVAPWELAWKLAWNPASWLNPDADRFATETMAHYRGKVRANQRRLTR